MKSKRLFFVLIILVSWQSVVFAYSSDDFLIGTYSYLKPYPENTTFNSNILSIMKSEGNYNVSICDNTLPDSYPASSVDGLLQAHYLQGIDPWLCDYHTGYNSTGEIISAGTHALSTGNYWRFEAEFFDIGRPYGYTEVDNNSNVYFHQFSRSIANRIGYATMDTGNIVPRKVWACSPDTTGIVLYGLRQRFPAADASNAVSNPPRYDRIGPEFRFTQWDRATGSETGPLGQHYLSWDKLYVRYVFRVASGSPNSNALSFKVICKNNSTGAYEPILINNVLNPGTPQLELIYTFNDLTSYSTNVDPDNLQDLYRSITFEIDLSYLRGTNLTPSGDTFLNTAGYWHCSFFTIDPYVYSYGNGTIYLDNVEIFDKLYDKLDDNPPTEVISWLNARLNDYSNTGLQRVKSFYTLDEPQLPHFASYSKLLNALQATSGSSKGCFSTVNWSGGIYKKPNGQRFSLPELFTNPENGYDPEELMIDYYPLHPKNNWNASNQDDLSGGLSIQSSIDFKMLSHYYAAKVRCMDIDIPFYVVPVSAGRWADYSIDQDRWDYYMMPTANMQKCLQLLPLCYGVDGVINWKLYDNYTTNALEEHDREPYETASERSQHDVYPTTAMKWYALIERNGNEIVSNTPQFEAICAANAKLGIYGNIMKTRGLNWINALCVKHTGPSINQVYDYAYNTPSPGIGVYLEDITSYDLEYPVNLAPYQGYVQVGFFEDSDSSPYYMAVNRRTDFVDNTTGEMELLTPNQLRTHYNEYGQANGFHAAPSQTVAFELSNSAYSHFGPTIGLYDPDAEHLYKQDNTEIKVDIDPGDGLLLEMVATLPSQVSTDTTLRRKVYLDGEITILASCDVVIQPNTEVIILPNTQINLDRAASLVFSGNVSVGDGVCFNISNDASILVSNAEFNVNGSLSIQGNGSFIVADSVECNYAMRSVVTVSDSTAIILSGRQNFKSLSTIRLSGNSELRFDNAELNLSHLVKFWIDNSILEFYSSYITVSSVTGDTIFVENQSCVNIINSTIRRMPIIVRGSDLYLENSYITVRENTSGISVNNPLTNRQVRIVNNNGRNGISGLSNQNTKGIDIVLSHSPIIIKNTDFSGLATAVNKITSTALPDSIYDCSFEDCTIGVYETSSSSIGRIENNSFTNIENTGIWLIGSIPTIAACSFISSGTGIRFDGSYYAPRLSGVYNSTFNLCDVAIESRASNPRVENCDFYLNEVGLLSHNDSNMNLAQNSYNCLRNENSNIKFYWDESYHSYIQLVSGHNDLYHFGISTFDFSFDDNYSSSTGYAIDASKNWFEGDSVRVNDTTYSDYVKVNAFDPEPNTLGTDPDGNNRFLVALHQEAIGQIDQAILMYETILNEQFESEKDYYNGCIDGLFRIKLIQDIQLTLLAQYIDQKIIQYTAVDSSFSKLLSDYLIKTHVARKDYQSAINLIQGRIDNPTSVIDSLRAVLDLEIVLQLAAIEPDKRPVQTKYNQYAYPSVDLFKTSHNAHWLMLTRLQQQEEISNIQVPTSPIISSNYPNPFNPSTTIAFSIPETGQVRVSVYNIKGQKVKDLLNTEMTRGNHRLVWDGRDTNNRSVGTGIYFFKLESGGKTSIRKTMLMK